MFVDLLKKHQQENILEKLPSASLEEQLKSVDWHALGRQQQKIGEPVEKRVLEPLKKISAQEELVHPYTGFEKRVLGCLIMAGGQATRLGCDLPKGVIAFSAVEQKSLFEIFAEKIKAFSRAYSTEVFLGVMTSEGTDSATKQHFAQHGYFGLERERVAFFEQSQLPLLDMSGQLCLDEQDKLMWGPDGNGSIFSAFSRSGLLSKWQEAGVEALSIIQVDNPLIDPFHPNLFAPIFSGAEITAAAVERKDPRERVGVFAQEGEHVVVAEYSEIDGTEYKAELFPWANISCFACSLPFASQASSHLLPLHMAKKVVQGQRVWKAEYFIFDHLLYTNKAEVVAIDRKEYFSPVKNKTGPDSVQTAQQALLDKDRRRYTALYGKRVENIELSQRAYYPSP